MWFQDNLVSSSIRGILGILLLNCDLRLKRRKSNSNTWSAAHVGTVFVVSRFLALFMIHNHCHHLTAQWHLPPKSTVIKTHLSATLSRSMASFSTSFWMFSISSTSTLMMMIIILVMMTSQPDHVEQIFDRSLTTTITQLASQFANLVNRNCNLLFLFVYLFIWFLSWCSLFRREQQRCQTKRFLFFLLTL